MIGDFFKAVQQIPDPSIRQVVRFGVVSAALTYGVTVAGAWLALSQITLFQTVWVDTGSDLVLGLLALLLPALLFPALTTSIISLKLEQVVEAVERRHYPFLPPPRRVVWSETLLGTLRFLLLMAVVNLLALPVYVVLLFTGFGFVLGLLINGYLLAREYFELVAARYADAGQQRQMFRTHLGWLWLRGVVIAVLFAIPLVNLLAPALATSFMVHSYQSLRLRTEAV